MNLLAILRIVAFAGSVFFAIVLLGLCAHLINLTSNFALVVFNFTSLGVATAVLNLVTLPAFFIIDRLRNGAFTSMLVVELAWISVLWVLWLATAALAANTTSIEFPTGCGFINATVESICREFSAVTGLAFVVWVILFAYSIALLVFALRARSRGHTGVWQSSVAGLDFAAPSEATEKTNTAPVQTTAPQFNNAASYPPQVQQPYQPYQQPQPQPYQTQQRPGTQTSPVSPSGSHPQV